jgi:hypothetical protein
VRGLRELFGLCRALGQMAAHLGMADLLPEKQGLRQSLQGLLRGLPAAVVRVLPV